MEAAPLTRAHHAARDASSHQLAQSLPEALRSHSQAADDFSAAARGVNDLEALRILGLLETQHRQLASLVSGVKNVQSKVAASSEPPPEQMSKAGGETSHTSAPIKRAPSPTITRRPRRDLSSSIASNLATARGIPPNKRSSLYGGPDSERQATVERDNSTQDALPAKSDRQSSSDRRSSADVPSRTSSAAPQTPSTPQPDPFEKFYSAFGGLVSKLSAPLAFAGLPLTPEEQAEQQPSEPPKPSRRPGFTRATTSSIPDVSKIFSKAALTAVKDGNPSFGGVQESFLVVPTSGGTKSYANIAAKNERSMKLGTVNERDEDQADEEFVDASEAPQQTSGKDFRSLPPRKSRKGRTMEEVEYLEVENENLKKRLDDMTQRLYMWEKNAQSQSVVLQRATRTAVSQPASHAGSGDTAQTVARLEEELKSTKKELEKYGRENEKLTTVVAKYRERWEKLKEGARTRREGGDRTAQTG